MFCLVKKLANVKKALKLWHALKQPISTRLSVARNDFDSIHQSLAKNHSDLVLQREEKKAHLVNCLLFKESMLKQKSRHKSLALEDCNYKFFYSLFRKNRKRSTIFSVKVSSGIVIVKPEQIQEVFIKHFQSILSPNWGHCHVIYLSALHVTGIVNSVEAQSLISPLSYKEIKQAIRGSNPQKCLGPNSFNGHFFKVCWPIIGIDASKAIQDSFLHGKLLKQRKHTFITLIS